MANIHLMLQGKGGVGKSLVMAMLAQYLRSKNKLTQVVDTDPVNATLHGFTDLNVARIELMEGDEINPRNFDSMIELIGHLEGDSVIDNGAASFTQLAKYLISQDVPDVLQQLGHQLVVHTVVTGGQSALDTINGFAALVKQFPDDTVFVVWLNPFWGPVAYDGKPFEQVKAYVNSKHRVAALIELPVFKAETFGVDFQQVLKARKTFDEALASDLSIMTRQRLTLIRKRIFSEIEKATVI